jgi:hypothetical protein
MRTFLAMAAVVGLLALSGCTNGIPGGPGAGTAPGGTRPSGAPAIGTGEGQFKLNAPTFGEGLKQGEQKKDTISISRGKNFDEDVTLKFENVPPGVTIDPASPTIKKSDTKTEITIKAADDAAVGKHTINVVGHPSKGPNAATEFTVNVHKK